MQYNKQQFNKVNDKKIMKKVKKQWVVVSVATLAFLGASAFGMVNTTSAHAADTQGTQNEKVKTNSNGSDSQQSSSNQAQSSNGSNGSEGNTQSNASSESASEATANRQAASKASAESAAKASAAAQSSAMSAGVADYVNGNSSAHSSVSSANQSDYSDAHAKASDAFNNTLNGASAASSSEANDSNYSAASSYATTAKSIADVAVSDAVYKTDNSGSYANNQLDSNYYRAAYAGASSAENDYNKATQNVGTGDKDYTYYKNTANSSYSSSYASGTPSSANVTSGYVNGSNAIYNADSAKAYTAQGNDSYNSNNGGADDPKTAHDTAISYENDISNKYDNNANTGLNGTSVENMASQNSFESDGEYSDALAAIYKYSYDHTLIQQGIKDAETGKWTGITNNSSGTNPTTDSIYKPQANSDNLYDQAYLGAQAAINTQFNNDSNGSGYKGVTQFSDSTISNLKLNASQAAAYKAGYTDVYNNDQQGIYYVSTGHQLNYLLTGGATVGGGGTTNSRLDGNHKNIINVINDISLSDNPTGNGGNNSITNYFNDLTIDGNNHIADWGNQNYAFNSTTGNQNLHLQNFKTIYGANYYGPVGFNGNGGTGNVYFKNINYIGAQLLSATSNQVFMDGDINVSQRDGYYTSPWQAKATNAGSGDQLNLDIANLVLSKGAHYFGTSGYQTGSAVVKVSNGNVTLSDDSSMTVVSRGTGGEGSASYGITIMGGSLNVNKNANLNVIPDVNASGVSRGGIYVSGTGANAKSVTVDGGRINIESANYNNAANNSLLYIAAGQVLVTNGGVLQAKATGLGTSSYGGSGLIYTAGGTLNVANRGNLILAIPDGSGTSSTYMIDGNLTVNDSGDSHVIIDKGNQNSPANFVTSGTINSYTGKVNGKIYYNYSLNSSNQVNALDENLNSITNQSYNSNSLSNGSPQILDIQSIPSVYFSSPLTTTETTNDGHTYIHVKGYAKVSGYDNAVNSGGSDADYAKNNKVYIQYAAGNVTGTSYDAYGNSTTGPAGYHDGGMNPLTNVSAAIKNDKNISSTTGTVTNGEITADKNTYNDVASPSQSIIPIDFTIDSTSSNPVQTVGVYLRYGVNGVNMTAMPSNNASGGSNYQSTIEGYQSDGNGGIQTASGANVQTASGKGQDSEDGYQAALTDFQNGTKNVDITRYGRNKDYTSSYDSVMAGLKAVTPDLLHTLGVDDISKAPDFDQLTPDQINKIQGTDEFKNSGNQTAYMQAIKKAYGDYLASRDAANAIANGDPNAATKVQNDSNNDSAYKNNYAKAYTNAQNALNDIANNNNKQNRPNDNDKVGQEVYDKVQQQYSDAQKAMTDAASGTTNNPNKLDADAYSAGQNAYKQIMQDIQSGNGKQDTNKAPLNQKSPLEQALYNQQFDAIKQKYDDGQKAALNGTNNPTDSNDPVYKAAYNAVKNGFNNGTDQDKSTADEKNTAAYKAGQQAKTYEQTGAQAAMSNADAKSDDQATKAGQDGLQATKDAYAVASGKLAKPDLTGKSLAYQDAYNAAQTNAQKLAQSAQDDYKNGVTTNTPTANNGKGVDAIAYNDIQQAAKDGANAANTPNSQALPDANASDAYKLGYNIAKGEADAENGKPQSSTNKDSNYATAFKNFNDAMSKGENAGLNDKPDTNDDQAAKDGFAYGQGIGAFKKAQNPEDPNGGHGLSDKQKAAFDSAKQGYDLAMNNSERPDSPVAAKAGFDYAKDLITGAGLTTEPDGSNATQKVAYDDVQNALAQAKQDIADGKQDANPDTSKSKNADVYTKAYEAAISAYKTQLSPDAKASDAGIGDDNPIGKAAFDKVKSDALNHSGTEDFINGKTNKYTGDKNYNPGYTEAQKGYVDALHGNIDSNNKSAAYVAGTKAANNDAQAFKNAENDNKDSSSPANQGATDAINAVRAANGDMTKLSPISTATDSGKSASYINAYNAALDDAKKAAQQGINSQVTPDDTNTTAPVPNALKDVYQAAANDAQKGYAEGLTGNDPQNSGNASEKAGNDQGKQDKAAYEAAVKAYNQATDKDSVPEPTDSSVNKDVYDQTVKALQDAASGQTTGNPNSPVYKVAYSQAKGANAAEKAIQAADDSLGKDTPTEISADDASIPADVKDKQSYVNAYNQSIEGYKDGLKGTDTDKSASKDSADQQAFNTGKDAGDKAHGANDALNGMKSKEDVASDLNSDNPAKKAYAQGVTDANDGYADGLNGNNVSGNNSNSPAYQKAKAQGQNDKAGYDAAKNENNPQNASQGGSYPDGVTTQQAKDAFNGYADAIAAVKGGNGNKPNTDRPADFDKHSADYKAAYQKALNDAVDANKAGQEAITDPSHAAARPTDAAQQAVYDAAKQAAQKGYAEGLTGKTASNPSDKSNEGAGVNAGASDKASYEAAVKAYNDASDKNNVAAAPGNVNANVYNETVKALKDAASGTTSNDNSPVYAVANSQALGSKAAEQAIANVNAGKNGSDPADMTLDKVPADVKDKQSYVNAYNNAIKGYKAGKSNDSTATATNSDPADQQAFLNGKLAGQAARGAEAALSGKATTDSVEDDLNSSDPVTKAYAQGVKDANDGYADGLNGNNASGNTSNSPEYLRAQAQGQADSSGYNEAKVQDTPDSTKVPSDLQNNTQASDAYEGYADAINAVENAHGDLNNIQNPSEGKSNDYMAAYQKALQDAKKYAQNGQNAVAKSSDNTADKSDAADKALQKVYADAKHDTNNGFAEAVSGKAPSSTNNANEQAGIDAGNKVAAAYQAAANDFASGNGNPTQPKHYSDDATQQKAYDDALKGLADGQNNGSNTNDPKDDSPVYAIANQQAQNVENALNAAKASQKVASGQPNKDTDLANAKGYSNADNQSDMSDAYQAAAQAYQDAKNHANGNSMDGGLSKEASTAAQMAYVQAYQDAQKANQAAIDDFAHGNSNEKPDVANAAANAVYAQAKKNIQSGMDAVLSAGGADQSKANTNPAYAQGVDDAAAIKAAAQDAVNGTPEAGKAGLTEAQKAAYDNIKSAADAGQQEYENDVDKYAGKTGDDLKNAAETAAKQQYSNDPLRQAAFAKAIESAGDAFGNGANAFANGSQKPSGISAAGYQAAQQAYDAAINGTGKPEKENGHYPTPQGVTPSDQYDKTFDAAYDKYKVAADKAAQDTAENGGTATTADAKFASHSDNTSTTAKEKAAYNAAATKAAQGIADAKLNDSNKNSSYGSTGSDGKFVPKDDIASQAYAGAKAGYADGKVGANKPDLTKVSPAFKAAYDKANADASEAAKAGVAEFANASAKSSKDGQNDAVSTAHNDGFKEAQAGYNATINDADPTKDHSKDNGANDANYMKGVVLAQAAIKARQTVEGNAAANNDSDTDTSSNDADVSGAAKAALVAAQNALTDGAKGNTAHQATPDDNKSYGKIYQDTYAKVHAEVQQSADEGAKAFTTGNSAQHKIPSDTDKSATTKANDEGYQAAQDAYNQAANDPADTNTSTTGSAVGDATYEAARAAFNDVANGTDHSNNYADNNSDPIAQIKHAAYQKALAEAKQNASKGAEALFDSNGNNSTDGATAKANATKAADRDYNAGLANAQNALNDAQASDATASDSNNDAKYSGDKANTDAGQVYKATRDAYKAVENADTPLSESQLDQKDPVYAAAYKNALAYAKSAATAGSEDANGSKDNGGSYGNNQAAKAVYEHARDAAQSAYTDALQGKHADKNDKKYQGTDKGSVAYQAAQNAINDYEANNGMAKKDHANAGISDDNADTYNTFYGKALTDIDNAAKAGVKAYENGMNINDIPSVEGNNSALGQVAYQAALRAQKAHDDVIKNNGNTSDANKGLVNDTSYEAGLAATKDAVNGEQKAMSDASVSNAPSAKDDVPGNDGFNGTVDGYNKAAKDGSISASNIDNYIAKNLGKKSVAYRDAFRKAYLDGLKQAKSGVDNALSNEPDKTAGQKGAAQQAQTLAYNDAKEAYQDALKGVTDPSKTANSVSAQAGRDKASQFMQALKDVSAGHPNTGNTDSNYQLGVKTAETAMNNAIADAKANKKVPSDINDIVVPNGLDSLAYRDVYAAILSGFGNGYGDKSDNPNSQDVYYQLAFKHGYDKGRASIPTDTTAPLDFIDYKTKPNFTDPAVSKAYDEQYKQASDGFFDGLNGRSADSKSSYYKQNYQIALDGLAGMKLAKTTKKHKARGIVATKDAAFGYGYRGYELGLAAAKRNARKHKKFAHTDLVGKNRMYVYAYKQALKAETKRQEKLGRKAAYKRAKSGHYMIRGLRSRHSVAYVRSYVKMYKRTFRRHMPRYIYNIRTIFTHNKVRYARKTRIKKFTYTKRYNSTVFHVVGVKFTKHGTPRYVLKSGRVVTANWNYVRNAYYKHNFKTFHVIKPAGVLVHVSKKFGRGNAVRRITRGQAFKIRKVVKYHGLTRLYIGHGEYVTSNKTYVKFGRK